MIVPRGDPEPRPASRRRRRSRAAPRGATRASGGRSSARCGLVPQEIEPEVEERGRHRPAVDLEVPLLEMPAARAHEQDGDLVVERVALLAGVELDRPLEGVGEVPLALDAVLPRGRVRVLEVGHEHLRAGVQGVDHHLSVDRARDLDPPVGDLLRERRDAPVRGAHRRGLGQEVRQLAAREPRQALRAPREELAPALAELALEVGQERRRVGCEDVVDAHRVIFSDALAASRPSVSRARGRARSAPGTCTARTPRA